MVSKFRKKPVVIEAEQFFYVKKPWPQGVIETELGGPGYGKYRDVGVQTLEGFMHANDGDWIITGVAGERYPCKESIFYATYELIED